MTNSQLLINKIIYRKHTVEEMLEIEQTGGTENSPFGKLRFLDDQKAKEIAYSYRLINLRKIEEYKTQLRRLINNL